MINRNLELIETERTRQDEKWGEQNHPLGFGGSGWFHEMGIAKRVCDENAASGTVTWVQILDEEVMEAFAATDENEFREELIQVAAVCVAILECMDRRSSKA